MPIPTPFTPTVRWALTITVTLEGALNVNGPLQDKMLCYGLLEMAKDAIRAHQVEPSRIVLPQNGRVG